MEYDRLKKRYFLELQSQLAKTERRHAEEIEHLSLQLSQQIHYNNDLLTQLQQLEQQQIATQSVVSEAKKLLAKTATERDSAIDACEKLQTENQDVIAKLTSITHERDEQIEESKLLSYDNKLFRDELLKVKEDIAKHKLLLEKNSVKEESQYLEDGADYFSPNNSRELLEHQQVLITEVEVLRSQLKQLDQSVYLERDRVEVLDLQLKKERSSLTTTLEALKLEQEKNHTLQEDCVKWVSQFATKENESKSLVLDVDFLQNELRTAHKQAANYALERDERATMCDALTAHSNKLLDKISGLESELEGARHDADVQRESHENEIMLLREENGGLLSELHSSAQARQLELAQKAQEFEEMKQNYEDSMREYCATLTQQCAGIQATLQEELRKILAEKTSVVQAAREEKVNMDAQVALLTSKLATAEAIAREMEARYNSELDALRQERDWLNISLVDVQKLAQDGYGMFEGNLQECKELCMALMSHYSALLSSVAPLPSVIQSLCNDQSAQTEVSLGQIQHLSQQFTTLTQQLEKIQDEKQMLDVLLEEEKSKSIMLQESNSTLQHMLQNAQAQGAVAQELSLVVDSKTQEINALNEDIRVLQDELQQQRVTASSLLAKLDVAHCQLQIVNEENERSLNSFAETTMQHSHQVAELEDQLQSVQSQHQSALAQRDAVSRESDGLRQQMEEVKATHANQMVQAQAEAASLAGQAKELSSQIQELTRVKTQVAELQQAVAEAKQQASQAQSAVLALQEQRKQLQSENIELKEELEHLYKHQQLLTSLQQQQQHSLASRAEPKLDTSIMEALKRQNKLIEDKCRMLQDNSMRMMKEFALPTSTTPAPPSPDLAGT